MIKPKTLRAWRGLLAAILLPAAVGAGPAQAADPAPLQVDQDIQKLKEQALDINQQAQAIEHDYLYPPRTRVDVYVGVHIPGMLLKDITVAVDDAAPVHYQYNELESIVLQERGLHRLLRLAAEPGSHRIRAQFSARYSDAKPGDPPFTGSYDGSFDKGQPPAELEFDLKRNGYLSDPQLQFHDWRAAQ
ncbi:MAG: hypothetical protein P4L83_08435 [Nevskia sp.]|nr:hypothetical protein [Nevskia sp.]